MRLTFGTTLVILLGSANAGADLLKPEEVSTPYQACKNVKVITQDEFRSNESGWKKEMSICGDRLQVSPKTGFWVGSVQPRDIAAALQLTNLVAAKSLVYLDKNIDFLKMAKACFENASSHKDCAQLKADTRKRMDAAVPELRRELLLTKGTHNMSHIYMKDLGWEGNINRFMEGYSGWLNYPVSGTPATAEEMDWAKKTLAAERKQMDKDYQAALAARRKHYDRNPALRNTEHEFEKNKYEQLLGQRMDARRENYRALLQQKYPLFSYLPRTKIVNGKGSWSDAQVAQSFGKLVENAGSEKEKSLKAYNGQKLEFSRLYDKVKKQQCGRGGCREVESWEINPERFWKGVVKGERDLLDFMAFTPLVEEVLREHPELCGMATGLSQHLVNKQMQNAAGTAAVLLPAFVGVGAIGVGGAAAAGSSLTGVQVATIMGVGMGAGFVGESAVDYSRTRETVLNKSGVAGEGVEKEVQDYKKIKEAERNLVLNAAFHQLDYIGAGAAGRVLFNAAKSKALTGDAARALAAVKPGAKVEARITNDAIADVLFKGRKPVEAEKSALDSLTDEMARKGFFVDAKASAEAQKENLNRYVDTVQSIFAKPAKTEAEVQAQKAAKAIFLNLDPAAVKEWDREGFNGLIGVYGKAIEELRTMPAAKLAKLEKDPRGQREVFRRALRKSGVADKREQDVLLECALPVRGAR